MGANLEWVRKQNQRDRENNECVLVPMDSMLVSEYLKLSSGCPLPVSIQVYFLEIEMWIVWVEKKKKIEYHQWRCLFFFMNVSIHMGLDNTLPIVKISITITVPNFRHTTVLKLTSIATNVFYLQLVFLPIIRRTTLNLEIIQPEQSRSNGLTLSILNIGINDVSIRTVLLSHKSLDLNIHRSKTK